MAQATGRGKRPADRHGTGSEAMNEQEDQIRAVVKRLRILWAGMLMGVVTFAIVVWILIRRGGIGRPMDSGMMATLAVIVALVLLVAPLVRRRLETTRRGASPAEIAQRWQVAWIVGQGIKEGVGIAGLVIGLLAGSTAWALGFAAASLGSMIMTPPWEHELRLRIHRSTGSAATSL
jgi:hypothetical protein